MFCVSGSPWRCQVEALGIAESGAPGPAPPKGRTRREMDIMLAGPILGPCP
jgi:hypothetical protein